jgi:uncharacterized membrane protein (DUF4010 family)
VNIDWLQASDFEPLARYLAALGIGLFIGLDRERNPTAKAGLRTCALVALAGALAVDLGEELSSPSIVAVGLAMVALMMIAAYHPHQSEAHDPEPGTTTIAAVIGCYLLGALVAAGSVQLAVILGVLTTLLLHFKAELGGMARNLDRREVVSILQFAVIAFVVLPVLPDEGFGPYHALNPRNIWLMVVLISGVSLAGFVAFRWAGRERGAMMLGALGGLVSSTATTLAYSRQAREGSVELAGTVIITANLVLLVRLPVLGAIVAPAILPILLPVFAASLVAGATVFALGRRRGAVEGALTLPSVANPAELQPAIGFGVMYAVVLVVSSWLADVWGRSGLFAAALVSGFVDVDAISLSNLRLFSASQASAFEATVAMVIAVAANAVFKLGIVRAAGTPALFRRCLPVLVASAAGAAVALGVLA